MSNVINFPNSNEFEDLSLSARSILIEQWYSDMNEALERIREDTASITALIEASKKFNK